MGKLTKPMAIFNSYVSLSEGSKKRWVSEKTERDRLVWENGQQQLDIFSNWYGLVGVDVANFEIWGFNKLTELANRNVPSGNLT